MDNTIGGWLAKLPEPYKTQALNNCIKHNTANQAKRVTTMGYAISSGFIWYKTPEGVEYWMDVQHRANKGEFNK